MLPLNNPTTPTEPQSFTVTPQINGTLAFDLAVPIVKPRNTLFQIVRSTNNADASVGTVVWEGQGNHVELVMPTSVHYYYGRCRADSYFSPYQPNTLGLGYACLPPAVHGYGIEAASDPDFQYSANLGERWNVDSGTHVFSLSLTGGASAGRAIIVFPTTTALTPRYYLYSVPTTPAAKWVQNEEFRGFLRMRATGVASWRSGASQFDLQIYGWSGVGVPSSLNTVPIGTGIANITTDSLDLAVNSWQDNAGSSSTGVFTNPNSYPYVCVALRTPANAYGGTYEVDFARAYS